MKGPEIELPYFAYFKKVTPHDGTIPVRACSRAQEQAILAHNKTDAIQFIPISKKEFYAMEKAMVAKIQRECNVENTLQQPQETSFIAHLKHPTNEEITRAFQPRDALILEKKGWKPVTERDYDEQQEQKRQALREQQLEDKRKQFRKEGIIQNPIKPPHRETSTRRVE